MTLQKNSKRFVNSQNFNYSFKKLQQLETIFYSINLKFQYT